MFESTNLKLNLINSDDVDTSSFLVGDHVKAYPSSRHRDADYSAISDTISNFYAFDNAREHKVEIWVELGRGQIIEIENCRKI